MTEDKTFTKRGRPMKNGDLSNMVAPTISFRVENFLVKEKDKTLKDKFLNLFIKDMSRVEIDEQVLATINYIFRRTTSCADLIIDAENYVTNKKLVKLLQDKVPHNRLIPIVNPIEIAVLLNIRDVTYHVDNPENFSLINHDNCITLDTVNLYIGRSKLWV